MKHRNYKMFLTGSHFQVFNFIVWNSFQMQEENYKQNRKPITKLLISSKAEIKYFKLQ